MRPRPVFVLACMNEFLTFMTIVVLVCCGVQLSVEKNRTFKRTFEDNWDGNNDLI